MSHKLFKTLLLIFLFFYLPLQSMAWGMLGHRIVGEIADAYLTPAARAEIKKILGDESIAMASNWADFVRSDTAYRYLNPWHYIDFKEGLTYAQMQGELKKDTAVDAYTRLNFLVRELKKKNLPRDKKIIYLKLLIHIVGDLHQPLHASPEGTMGGNGIKVFWFNEPTNLHHVWDEDLIGYQKLSYTEYVSAINHTTLAQRKAWQSQPISQWIFNSYVISGQLQQEIREKEPKLSYRYNYDHIETINQQLLIGGVHLAGLLNQIFGK